MGPCPSRGERRTGKLGFSLFEFDFSISHQCLVSPGFVPFNSKMVITPPPALTPELPGIHDLPLCDFILDERYGRHPIAESRDP